MALAKTLGNLPGNVCTPGYLATTARKLAKEHKIKVRDPGTRRHGKARHGFAARRRPGSHEPPRFIILQLQAAASPRTKPVVLVGKGITFDTGGISLKPGLRHG
jgi:leucyl aminopeptidase